MKMITIFTPTYNRGYCLEKLYDSLCNQNDDDFIWLIIDDGSNDNTKMLVESWISKKKISIIYKYKMNGGKHTAHNLAVKLCDTELFVCVDSDDSLSQNAVKTIKTRYNECKDKKILGLYLRKQYYNGRMMAGTYPKGIRYVGLTELYHRYGFQGDTVIVLNSKLIKPYSFPVVSGERFVSERYYYNMLDSIAPMYLCEDVIYYGEYLEDGYTMNAKRLISLNPIGTAMFLLSEAYYSIKFIDKIKSYSQFVAMKKVFSLENETFSNIPKPCLSVKLLSYIVLPHYLKLYNELREVK